MTSDTARPPLRLLLVTLLTLVGLGLGSYLTKHFYEARAGVGDGSSCDVSGTVSCTRVAESAEAELLPGVPLSSVAAGGFAAMLLLSLLARGADRRAEALRLLLLMAIAASLASLYYIGVMAFKLRVWCLYCLGIDAIDFTLLALLISLRPRGPGDSPRNYRQWVWNLLLSAVTLVAVFIALSRFAETGPAEAPAAGLPPVAASAPSAVGMQNASSPGPLPGDSAASSAASEPPAFKPLPPGLAAAVQKTLDSRPVTVDAGPQLPAIGPASAKVTIVEFSDFQCPHCKHALDLLADMNRRFPGKLRIVYRHFPLDMACNPIIRQPFHLAACESARVAICGHRQGKYEAVTASLFQHQEELAPGAPQPLAVAAGLDPDRLGKCLADASTSDALRHDVDEGVRLEIHGTPAFYINRHPMEYGPQAPPNEVMPVVIERLLAAPPPSAPAR